MRFFVNVIGETQPPGWMEQPKFDEFVSFHRLHATEEEPPLTIHGAGFGICLAPPVVFASDDANSLKAIVTCFPNTRSSAWNGNKWMRVREEVLKRYERKPE